MYRVISPFRDLKNDEHHYAVGDVYPVEGYKPTKARIKELAEGKNPLNRVFIVEEPSEETAVSELELEPSEETPDKMIEKEVRQHDSGGKADRSQGHGRKF